ncbi:hypothetical protein Cabys_256 [Caldithrix abyssi DSM 13497]|uniref:Uncharacterized protein n=1 Tax=Caldithrix abyssi DSM 13497 TaxID=880073 RepID=A0A1J1C2X8_CALAY|nr:hypothetical protein Cabys_256 [Caldithrix abyssi DSM 13497]
MSPFNPSFSFFQTRNLINLFKKSHLYFMYECTINSQKTQAPCFVL